MAKKRANGEGNLRKRKDGRWEGRYTAGYDQNGKRLIKNVLGRTQAEVKEKLSVAIAESQQLGCLPDPGNTPWQSGCGCGSSCTASQHRPSTAGYYKRGIEQYTVPRIGATKLNNSPAGRFRSSTKTCWRMGGSGKNRERNALASAVPRYEASTSCSTVPWTGR